jgi:hypothetical protein
MNHITNTTGNESIVSICGHYKYNHRNAQYIAKYLNMLALRAADVSYLFSQKTVISYFSISSMWSFSIKFTWNNCSLRTKSTSLPCLFIFWKSQHKLHKVSKCYIDQDLELNSSYSGQLREPEHWTQLYYIRRDEMHWYWNQRTPSGKVTTKHTKNSPHHHTL